MTIPTARFGDSTPGVSQSVFTAVDRDGDREISSSEFNAFLLTIVAELIRGSGADVAGSAVTINLPAAALATPPIFSGFDPSRAQSAAGSLKYDAYNVLQKYDPADPTAMRRAFAELDALHPGQYELDAQKNLMLTGTADGYIGERPVNRNSDWEDRTQPWQWQWMGYNEAHPGPNGETT